LYQTKREEKETVGFCANKDAALHEPFGVIIYMVDASKWQDVS